MSRLQNYKTSLQRFVKEKNCLFVDNTYKTKNYNCDCENECSNQCKETSNNINCSNCKKCSSCTNCVNCKKTKTALFCQNCLDCKNCYNCGICNRDINNYIYSLIQKNDSVYSTLFLTILNNQNKKNHISLQGYYIAVTIELFDVLINIIENREAVIKMFNVNKYIKMCNNLFIYAEKALQQNIQSVKNVFVAHNLSNIIINSTSLLTETFKNIIELSDNNIELTNKICNLNVIDWYLKNNEKLTKKFKSLNQITKDSLNVYINKKYFYMSEFTIALGWMFGNGTIESVSNFKKTAKYFGTMYSLSKNFGNLEKDVETSSIYSSNYVLNFGLQEGYEEFINNKQSFIADMLSEDIYTITVKEIIDKIELDIDTIIDLTSPDLKSNYSMDQSNKKSNI